MADRPDLAALRLLIEGSGVRKRANNRSWIFTCPRCSKKDKLYIRKTDGRFVCWHCSSDENAAGYQGRPEFALRDLLGLALDDICLRLYGEGTPSYETGGRVILPDLADFFDDAEEAPYDLIPLPLQVLDFEFHELDEPGAEKGRAYLENERGVPLEVAKRYGIMYHPRDRRVIFPIKVDNRLVGWQGRLIEDHHYIDGETGEECEGLKILTYPPALDRNRCLMFQDRLIGHDTAILTEGPLDGIKADLCPAGNVPAMGKKVSPGQIAIIKERCKKVYLGLDPDAAGEFTRLAREFSDLEVRKLVPPDGFDGDLGKMTFAGVLERFRTAPLVRSANIFLPPLIRPPPMATANDADGGHA